MEKVDHVVDFCANKTTFVVVCCTFFKGFKVRDKRETPFVLWYASGDQLGGSSGHGCGRRPLTD